MKKKHFSFITKEEQEQINDEKLNSFNNKFTTKKNRALVDLGFDDPLDSLRKERLAEFMATLERKKKKYSR